jgi:hypothetical protein
LYLVEFVVAVGRELIEGNAVTGCFFAMEYISGVKIAIPIVLRKCSRIISKAIWSTESVTDRYLH